MGGCFAYRTLLISLTLAPMACMVPSASMASWKTFQASVPALWRLEMSWPIGGGVGGWLRRWRRAKRLE